MAAVWVRARAELRARWRAWLGLMLLLGLAGGTVMALAAGARRTDTAYDRLVAAERPADLEIRITNLLEGAEGRDPVTLDQLEHLPGLVESGRFLEFAADQGDNRSLLTDTYFETLAPEDQGAVGFVARWKLLAGRHADPARADEAMIGFTVAEQYRLRVGSPLRLRLLTREEAGVLYQDGTLVRLPPASTGRWVDLRVVGVVAPAGQFPPRVGVPVGAVMLTPAYARAVGDRYAVDERLRVRAAGGDGLRRFGARVERLTGKPLDEVGDSGADTAALTRRALHLPAVAMRLMAALAAGAAITWDGLEQLLSASTNPSRNLLLLRWASGVDAQQASAGLAAETRRLILPQQPADVANFGRVENLPVLFAALVAAVATAMLIHPLGTSVRRRRDLAVLKTLGFTRAQVSGAVAWQATVLAAIALVVGLPFGVAAGRWLWTLFATRIYVLPEPVVPRQTVLLLVPATVLVANLVAAVPAWMAARTRPATVLRAE